MCTVVCSLDMIEVEMTYTALFRNIFLINSCCISLYLLILHSTNFRELKMYFLYPIK